jgi:hypothetical protein
VASTPNVRPRTTLQEVVGCVTVKREYGGKVRWVTDAAESSVVINRQSLIAADPYRGVMTPKVVFDHS